MHRQDRPLKLPPISNGLAPVPETKTLAQAEVEQDKENDGDKSPHLRIILPPVDASPRGVPKTPLSTTAQCMDALLDLPSPNAGALLLQTTPRTRFMLSDFIKAAESRCFESIKERVRHHDYDALNKEYLEGLSAMVKNANQVFFSEDSRRPGRFGWMSAYNKEHSKPKPPDDKKTPRSSVQTQLQPPSSRKATPRG